MGDRSWYPNNIDVKGDLRCFTKGLHGRFITVNFKGKEEGCCSMAHMGLFLYLLNLDYCGKITTSCFICPLFPRIMYARYFAYDVK